MPLSSGSIKIIFVLLIKVVTLYMQIAIVEIGISRFEKIIGIVFWFYYWRLIPNLFDTNFNKLLKQNIDKNRL